MKSKIESTKDNSNSIFSYADYISNICDRIEIGISKGLYAKPSKLFFKKIKGLGFPSIKSFLTDYAKEISQQLESKNDGELSALNIGDISHPKISLNFINESDSYEFQLGRMMIFEMAIDIRKVKASNNSINVSELSFPLSVLKNLINDLSFITNTEFYKKEIAFLKDEIERPILFQTIEPSETVNLKYFDGKTNNFNKVSLERVTKYFMQLTEESQRPFLKKEDVLKFIDKAFCGNNKIKILTLNNTIGKKGLIWQLFYNFFMECTADYEYESSKHVKKKYVMLLTSNFRNWDYKNVFDNFSKSKSKHWKKLSDF